MPQTAARQTTLDAEPLAVRRLSRPGDTVAHLFSDGPGWSRSMCRGVMWTAALREPTDVARGCEDCDVVATELGAEVREPRIPESELRALAGDR